MTPKIILPEKIKHIVEVDPKRWVWVTGTNKFISVEQHHDRWQWEQVLTKVESETPSYHVAPLYLFAPHLVEVYASTSREKNKPTLYDGAGEPLSRKTRNDLYEIRTMDTWILLDAYFEKKRNKLLIATDHRLVNGKLKPRTQQSLETCVMHDAFVDLVFNTQGFPTQRSEKQEYQRGRNIHYSFPREYHVVGFTASEHYNDLNCGRSPRISGGPTLGVLLCVEGTTKK